MKIGKLLWLSFITFTLTIVPSALMTFAAEKTLSNHYNNFLLTDPFLQFPTKTTVNVVWFTDFLGSNHHVQYGDQLNRQVSANTKKLSRVREDPDSYLDHPPDKKIYRDIWRHEAIISGLEPNQRLPYQVFSNIEKQSIASKVFTLAGQPEADTPLKILLTSDHQLMPMTTANLEQVVKTVSRIDAVFFPGDLVNTPDRASEWFDDRRGGAFFQLCRVELIMSWKAMGLRLFTKEEKLFNMLLCLPRSAIMRLWVRNLLLKNLNLRKNLINLSLAK